MLLPLLLLDYDCSFDIQVIFFLKDIIQRWVCSSINADLLKFIPEMVLYRLFLEGVALHDDVIFPLKDETIEDEILFL